MYNYSYTYYNFESDDKIIINNYYYDNYNQINFKPY